MNKCGYCSSSSLSPYLDRVTDRLRHVKGEFSFVKCAECGAVWLDPAPSPEQLASFYPDVYGLRKGAGRGMSAVELALWFGPVYRRNARLLKRRAPRAKTLLDVGCGSGYQAACFKQSGFQVTGLDFADGTAEWMRRAHSIEAFDCSAEDMSGTLGDRRFDVITAFHVVEHMLQPEAFLRMLMEHLKPEGQIFFSAPLVDSFQAHLFGRHWGAFREAPRHVNLPSRHGLRTLFERCSLSDVCVQADHVYYLAGSAFASLSSALSMTASYSESSSVSLICRRLCGAVLAALYLPAACCEMIGSNYSMGLIFGRKN